jgi:hypothetical protein
MPVTLLNHTDARGSERGQDLGSLCDDLWDLPSQIDELEKWLLTDGVKLTPGRYSADIGFSPRPGAAGGGSSLSPNALKIMGEKGISLHFSEYPEISDD